MERVCVMISTYNGESFIREQIDSILAQINVDVTLMIRDDGSSDNTVDIIGEYQDKYPIIIIKGTNVGWQKSFHMLLRDSAKYGEFDYYAFADQDDIWVNSKLERAIKRLKSTNDEVALYGSQIACFNDKSSDLFPLYSNIENTKNSLKSRYFLGVAPFGCTMVWSTGLQKKYLEQKVETDISHDIWMHLLARCFGTVVVDDSSYIKHRIHQHNAAGVEKNQIKRIKKFFKVYMNKKYVTCSEMMEFFVKSYGEQYLEKQYKEFILLMIMYRRDFATRIALLRSSYIRSLDNKIKLRVMLFVMINKL